MLGNPNNLTTFETLILGSGNDYIMLSKILKHFLQCKFVNLWTGYAKQRAHRGPVFFILRVDADTTSPIPIVIFG